MLLHFADDGLIHRNLVLADDDAFRRIGSAQLVEPLRLPDLLQFETLLRVRIQDSFQQFLALVRKHFGGFVLASDDFFIEFVGIRIFEGEVAAEHSIEDNAAAPDIGAETLVLLACNHFWGSVAGTATRSFEFLAWLVLVGQPEVYYLDVALMVQQQVLRFQVPVHNIILVDVLNPSENLMHK